MVTGLHSQRQTGLNPVSNSSGYREGRANRPAMRSKAHQLVVRCRATTFVIVACIGLVVAAHAGRDRRGGGSTGASALEKTNRKRCVSQRAAGEAGLRAEEGGR